jgi:hypothetical protein
MSEQAPNKAGNEACSITVGLPDIKIGDALWCHDYRSNQRPWFEDTIKGETRISWLLGYQGSIKVNKKTMLENCGTMGSRQWHTPESKAERDWLTSHRRKIGDLVIATRDVATLQKVAELIGYEAKA